jgi:hypothetical protein
LELTTLRLLFVGGLLVMGVAIVLVGLAMQRLADWVKSRAERAVTQRPSLARWASHSSRCANVSTTIASRRTSAVRMERSDPRRKPPATTPT